MAGAARTAIIATPVARCVCMQRIRFTLQDLIAFVGLAACVFAAGRASGEPLLAAWVALVLLTLGTLCWASVAIFYRRGAARAFWSGFATFGWSYAVLLYSLILFSGSRLEMNDLFLSLHLLVFPFAWLGGLICKRFASDTDDSN